jgi:lactate permease
MDKGVALTWVTWLLAFLPILMLLSTILFFRWGAPKSGAVSWFTAVAVSVLVFGAHPRLLALANSKGMGLALYVLLIIWSAVFLYNIVESLGAVKVIGNNMAKVTNDRLLQCLLMSWCFSAFMQGIAGFGVPIAVVAPIMVVMGFPPAVAAATCLVGHSWAVTFGSMGAGYYTIQLITKIPGEVIAPWMAILFVVPIVTTGFAVAHIYGGFSAIKRGTPAILITSAVMGFSCWLMTIIGAAQLASLIPGLLGCGTMALLARTGLYREAKAGGPTGQVVAPRELGFNLAFSPYYILILLSIASQIKGISRIIAPYAFGMDYPAVQTTMKFAVKAEKMYARIGMSHPAPLLLMAAILSFLVFSAAGRWKPGVAIKAFKTTLTQCIPTSVGIISMVMMALVMVDSGMTFLLAQGMAKATGRLFPLASTYIGVLGAFLTGSGANSNVMFAALQVETAKALGISTVIIAAAQSVGGSIGGAVAPAKVLLGATMVGLDGRESEVMNKTVPYCAAVALCTGIVAWSFVYIFFRTLQ